MWKLNAKCLCAPSLNRPMPAAWKVGVHCAWAEQTTELPNVLCGRLFFLEGGGSKFIRNNGVYIHATFFTNASIMQLFYIYIVIWSNDNINESICSIPD